jgi:DNA-binding MarR family transcriptional regulator
MSAAKHNLRYLLMHRSAWFEERILQEAERHGYGYVTPSMNRLFAHMRHRPVSISDLARSLDVSRQAAHQTLSEAMRHGLVELVHSEDDKRVKLVRFSKKGLEMSAIAAKSIARIEQELESRIGRTDMEALRRILEKTW